MSHFHKEVIIIGSGIFGLSMAYELLNRGYKVTVVDPSAQGEPYELAASTDISKIVRGDYGEHTAYADLCIDSIQGWHKWNREFGEEMYHEVGIFVLSLKPMEEDPKGFANLSWEYMKKSPFYKVERLNENLKKQYPQYHWNEFADGYLNRTAGWVNSSLACTVLKKQISKFESCTLVNGQVSKILYSDTENPSQLQVVGVQLEDSRILTCPSVVLAGGPFSPFLFPTLYQLIKPSAVLVTHYSTENMEKDFSGDKFPVTAFDLANTGLYGFPYQPEAKVLKIGHHTTGYPILNSSISKPLLTKMLQNDTTHEQKQVNDWMKRFLRAPLKVVRTKLCVYCDTFDGDFLIDFHPDRKGLFLMTGGSGHGFKFGPSLGKQGADIFEGKPSRFAHLWKWRLPPNSTPKQEKLDPFIYRPSSNL